VLCRTLHLLLLLLLRRRSDSTCWAVRLAVTAGIVHQPAAHIHRCVSSRYGTLALCPVVVQWLSGQGRYAAGCRRRPELDSYGHTITE
jgi:hypothetical protein